MGGYQADVDAGNRYAGMLYEEGGRGILARRGLRVVIDAEGAVNAVGSVGDPEELGAEIDRTDWNTYEIVARDNHPVHRVNGNMTMDTDFALRHVGNGATVEVTVFLNFLNIHERRSGYNVVLYHINYSCYHTTYFSKVK